MGKENALTPHFGVVEFQNDVTRANIKHRNRDLYARIREFRYPDLNQQVWWPSGRHNSASE